MIVSCPNCSKKYKIDSDQLAQIKKRKPKCRDCGADIFPSEELYGQIISSEDNFAKSEPHDHSATQNNRAQNPGQVAGPDATEKDKADSSDRTHVPKTIGPYKVEKLIGRGGMGSVYKCLDESLNRYVAIKVLMLQEEKSRKRFLLEAQALAKLTHPNITQIYTAGQADGSPYFVMEYIDGESTEALLKGGRRFSVLKSLDIAIQVCEGLNAANRMGVIHRDIKPGNILIGSDDTVKITDFGLAKLASSDLTLTETKMTMGTPHYLSPEQGRGEKTDFRTDMYSLGVMLYRFIFGRPPFTADDPVALILMHIREPVKFPAPSASFSVQPAVTGLIRKLMAKKPNDRFFNYGQLIDELARLKKSIQARQTNESDRLGPTRDDHTVPEKTTKYFETKVDPTVVIPTRSSSGPSFHIPRPLMMLIVILILFGFFGLLIKFGINNTPSEPVVAEITTINPVEEEIQNAVPISQPNFQSNSNMAETEPMEFEFQEHSIEEMGNNSYRVFGTIRNIGTTPIKNLSVRVNLLDLFDESIAEQEMQIEPATVLPGEYARFSIVFKEVEFLDHYRINITDETIEGTL